VVGNTESKTLDWKELKKVIRIQINTPLVSIYEAIAAYSDEGEIKDVYGYQLKETL
jgi:hypothetical protein